MTHVTCWLTANNRDHLRNRTLGNRVWATFTFLLKITKSRRVSLAVIVGIDRWPWLRCHTRLFSLLRYATCECLITGRSCDSAFQVGSSCYKVHKNERVNWFTAVNRCLSMNASLAAFTDDVHRYFPSSLLSDNAPAWIGLLKSWWTWPALSELTIIFDVDT